MKKILSFSMAVIMAVCSLNCVYGESVEEYDLDESVEEYDLDESEAEEDVIESGEAVENSSISLMASDTDSRYSVEGGYIYYNRDTGIITGCDDTVIDLVIPNMIYGMKVTGIGNYAFDGCSNLTSITIPDSVARINSFAFYNCTGLTDLSLPDSVTRIGVEAFSGCTNLKKITMPDGVTTIAQGAFRNCSSLEDVRIPSSVDYIGSSVFSGCNGLGNITIPDSVTSIGEYAFSGCSGLGNITIPDGVTSIGEYAFSGCSGLENITISDGVTSIGEYAFSGCSGLGNITIPASVTSIGEYAFSGCNNLTDINVDENNAEYSSYDGVLYNFTKTGLIVCPGSKTNITIPDSILWLSESAFFGCANLIDISVDENNTRFSSYDGVLYNKDKTILEVCPGGKTNITIPENTIDMQHVERLVFEECNNLTDINVDENNTEYSSYDGVLYNKDKSKLIFCPNGKTNVIIPDGVTSIWYSAFSGCINLEKLTIQGENIEIYGEAFENCGDLSSLIFSKDIILTAYYKYDKYFNNTNIKSLIIYGDILDIDSNLKMSYDTLYCYKDSSAEIEAEKNHIPTKIIGQYGNDGSKIKLYPIGEYSSGTEQKITAEILQGSTDTSDITWTSSNTDIVEVMQDSTDKLSCYLKCKSVGECEITVSNSSGATAVCYVTVTQGDVVSGDIDGDGEISSTDATYILLHTSGTRLLTESATEAADVNGDGEVTSTDATYILLKAAGLRDF